MFGNLFDRLTKGSRFRPYEQQEFPRYHIEGMDSDELDELEDIWNSNPEIWKPEQPDFDLLFDIFEGRQD